MNSPEFTANRSRIGSYAYWGWFLAGGCACIAPSTQAPDGTPSHAQASVLPNVQRHTAQPINALSSVELAVTTQLIPNIRVPPAASCLARKVASQWAVFDVQPNKVQRRQFAESCGLAGVEYSTCYRSIRIRDLQGVNANGAPEPSSKQLKTVVARLHRTLEEKLQQPNQQFGVGYEVGPNLANLTIVVYPNNALIHP